jgi:hypothetical protein
MQENIVSIPRRSRVASYAPVVAFLGGVRLGHARERPGENGGL